jgi:hypothetical protein
MAMSATSVATTALASSVTADAPLDTSADETRVGVLDVTGCAHVWLCAR